MWNDTAVVLLQWKYQLGCSTKSQYKMPDKSKQCQTCWSSSCYLSQHMYFSVLIAKSQETNWDSEVSADDRNLGTSMEPSPGRISGTNSRFGTFLLFDILNVFAFQCLKVPSWDKLYFSGSAQLWKNVICVQSRKLHCTEVVHHLKIMQHRTIIIRKLRAHELWKIYWEWLP